MESAGASSRSKGLSAKRAYPQYAVCVDNEGNEVSLDLGRVYKIVRPLKNDPPYMVRVIDNEAEDYLYMEKQFVPVDLPPKGRRAVAMAKPLGG